MTAPDEDPKQMPRTITPANPADVTRVVRSIRINGFCIFNKAPDE
jgi:hypothetical protein